MEKAMTLREVTDYLDRLRVQFMATIRLDGDFATTRSSEIFLLVIAKIFSLGFLQEETCRQPLNILKPRRVLK